MFYFSDGDLYSGTVADFSATDALIIKDQLRTEQYDYKHLNSKFPFNGNSLGNTLAKIKSLDNTLAKN